MKKYIGFRLPTLEWNGYEWLEELLDNKGHYKAYVIKAKNADDARRKLFEEIFEEEYYSCYVLDYLKEAIESYDEEENIKEYGEIDGKIINELLDEFYNMTKEKLLEIRFDKRIDKLSTQTIKELCYIQVITQLGIMEIAKEI